MSGKMGMLSRKATKPEQLAQTWRPGWLGAVDKRSGMYLALRDRLEALYADLGGRDNLSTMQEMLCERVVFIELRCRDLESSAIRGDPVQFGVYGHLSNVLSGLLLKLGLHRQARSITSLSDIDD